MDTSFINLLLYQSAYDCEKKYLPILIKMLDVNIISFDDIIKAIDNDLKIGSMSSYDMALFILEYLASNDLITTDRVKRLLKLNFSIYEPEKYEPFVNIIVQYDWLISDIDIILLLPESICVEYFKLEKDKPFQYYYDFPKKCALLHIKAAKYAIKAIDDSVGMDYIIKNLNTLKYSHVGGISTKLWSIYLEKISSRPDYIDILVRSLTDLTTITEQLLPHIDNIVEEYPDISDYICMVCPSLEIYTRSTRLVAYAPYMRYYYYNMANKSIINILAFHDIGVDKHHPIRARPELFDDVDNNIKYTVIEMSKIAQRMLDAMENDALLNDFINLLERHNYV